MDTATAMVAGGAIVLAGWVMVASARTVIASGMPPGITAEEVADKLQAVADGKLAIKNIYASGTEGYEIVTADGWSIDLGWDDGLLTYTIDASAPGDRPAMPWPVDPLDILEKRDPALVGLLALKAKDAVKAKIAKAKDDLQAIDMCECDECNCAGCSVAGAADEPIEPVQCWDDKPGESIDLSDVGPHTWPMWPPDTSPEVAVEIVRRVHDKKWVAKFVALLGGG